MGFEPTSFTSFYIVKNSSCVFVQIVKHSRSEGAALNAGKTRASLREKHLALLDRAELQSTLARGRSAGYAKNDSFFKHYIRETLTFFAYAASMCEVTLHNYLHKLLCLLSLHKQAFRAHIIFKLLLTILNFSL